MEMKIWPWLFVLTITIKSGLTIQTGNGSALYFPEDNYDRGIPQLIYNHSVKFAAPTQLETIRGTTLYEDYVTKIIANGITRVTLALNHLLLSESVGTTNIVFSPISITTAMALVFLGSNGVTFKEISQMWGLTSGLADIDKKSLIVHEQLSRMINKLIASSGFDLGEEVDVGTAIFVQTGFPIRPLYKSTAEDLYRSSVVQVDFERNPTQAQEEINKWVSNETKGKIKYILSDTPPSATRIIVASALYFKAEWEQHFMHRSTRKRPFYVNGRKSPTNVEVEMMANGGEFPYYRDFHTGCEILGFPYKGNKSVMYVIMPFESSKDKLREYEQKLTVQDLNRLVESTRVTGATILFPKMKIESTVDLKDTLKQMGVTSLFDPHRANLALLSPGAGGLIPNQVVDNTRTRFGRMSNLTQQSFVLGSRVGTAQTLDNIRQLINEQSVDNNFQNPGLYADNIIHKVFMDITETGTEAAATTSISLSRDGSRVAFRVDVPFIYFIRNEETKTILFWGSVVLPTPSSSSS